MKTGKNIRFSNKVKNVTNNFFSLHKVQFVLCLFFVILGAVIAVLIINKFSSNITLENMFDKNLLYMLEGKRALFGLFFSYLWIFLLSCFIIIFLNFKPWLMIFTYLILFINGYVIAYNITILIILFDFTGFINAIIIYLPLELLSLLILIIISCISIKRGLIIKKYGCSYWSNCQTSYNLKQVFLWLVLSGVVLLFIKSLIMPVIRITIIVA